MRFVAIGEENEKLIRENEQKLASAEIFSPVLM